MLTRIIVDINIDIGHGFQEKKGTHIRIDREAEADVNVTEVKYFFIFYFILNFIFFIYFIIYYNILLKLKKFII